MANQYQTLQKQGGNPREVAQVVNLIMDGKTNNTGAVTLTANSSTTTVDDRRAGADSVILFMPTTANAAAEKDDLYVSSRGKQTFTITHSNNSQTDRTFGYAIVG
jgi:hypothetical protein